MIKTSAELAQMLEENLDVSKDLINDCCLRVGWSPVIEPFAQWDYEHCVTDSGGVIPFSIQGLIRSLKSLEQT